MKKYIRQIVFISLGWLSVLTFLAPSAFAYTPTIKEFNVPSGSGAQPFHITEGPDGNLWFTEQTGDKIGKITPSGTITEYSVPTVNAQPGSIAAGPDGNLWFTEFSGYNVGKITPNGIITEYSVSGTAEYGGIAAGPDGNLWFTYINSNSIGKISPTGTVTSYTDPAGGGEQYIAAGPDGNMWYTLQNANKIGKISPTGTVTDYTAPGTNPEPQDIVKGPDGNMWYTEFNGNNITKVTTSGTFTQYPIPTASSVPWGITVGPDGDLWFAEQGGNKIGQMTTQGTITEYTVPTSNSLPAGVVTGPDGNIWFTEVGTGKIGELVLPSKPAITSLNSTVTAGGSVTVDVLSGVSGSPDPATLKIVSGPAHGTAVDPPGTITYTPNAGYTGTDSLTYQVCSLYDSGICAQAALNFNVISANVAAPATGDGTHNQTPWQAQALLAIFSAAAVFAGARLWRRPTSS